MAKHPQILIYWDINHSSKLAEESRNRNWTIELLWKSNTQEKQMNSNFFFLIIKDRICLYANFSDISHNIFKWELVPELCFLACIVLKVSCEGPNWVFTAWLVSFCEVTSGRCFYQTSLRDIQRYLTVAILLWEAEKAKRSSLEVWSMAMDSKVFVLVP